MESQPQPGSNNYVASLDSAVTLESQHQPQSDDVASLKSSVQQESQAKPPQESPAKSPQESQAKSPYFKFTLPYEGTITCTVSVMPSPNSPEPDYTSNPYKGKLPEQAVFNAASNDNNNADHKGAQC